MIAIANLISKMVDLGLICRISRQSPARLAQSAQILVTVGSRERPARL